MNKRSRILRLILSAFGILVLVTSCIPDITTTPGPGITPTPGGLPDMPNKPLPKETTFKGCPPEGDGGDTIQNRLKNRIDDGDYVPVSFDAIMSLSWPKTVEQLDRIDWSAEDTATIAKYEGIPVVVEGYLAGGKEAGAESTNCHGTTPDMLDWHVWFVKDAGAGREISIVVEPTPRSRANHQWTLAKLQPIIDNQIQVRISGWVFFDPEHPDQLAKTRGTLWEIHPVMQIEVAQNGQWIPLDDWNG